MDSSILYKSLNEGVIEEKFHAFKMNLEKNLDYIRRFGGLQNILPRLKGKNILITGAGPSLDHDINLLKKYQFRGDIVIISADMALLPLAKRGIFPHFVISCEVTPIDYFSNINTENMHLLAFSCMSNTNLRKWKGAVSFYNWMIHNEVYEILWERAGLHLGFVATGSIVTTQAISMALGCGIRSLMLIGNDMGFNTEYYTKGTGIYKRNLNIMDRFKSLEAIELNTAKRKSEFKINRGDKYYFTNNQFLAAKMWLEDLFKQQNIPIYESSNLGCSPQFVHKLSLNKYMKRFDKSTTRRRK